MLKIALPSGKSLESRTCGMLDESRITMRREPSSHIALFPESESLESGCFLKPRRIPTLVSEGKFDIGIVGEDLVLESGADVEICARLSFNKSTTTKARGALFVHKDDSITCVEDIPQDSVVLSEYPNLTKKFFAKNGRSDIKIEGSPGSVEAEIPNIYRLGVVLSETGNSLLVNNLRVIAELFTSETILIANRDTLKDDQSKMCVDNLVTILMSTVKSYGNISLMFTVSKTNLDETLSKLPSLEIARISELTNESGCSVHSIVSRCKLNKVALRLLKSGATNIIATPITSFFKG